MKTVTSEKILLPAVRGSFLKLAKPVYFRDTPAPNEKPKYQASFLLDPQNAQHAAAIKMIKSEASRIAKLSFPDGVPKSMEKCFGTSDELDKVYDGYDGMFWFRSSSIDRVPIVGPRKNAEGKFTPVQEGDEFWPYSGCYLNAKVAMWVQTTHGRKGINGNLIALQFVKHGDAFGRPSADPDSEFEELSIDDTADDDIAF